jgi:hypothetical protein
MTDDKIRAAIKIECDRQHVGEDRQEWLLGAYANTRDFFSKRPLDRFSLETIAYEIEEDNQGDYRHGPVTFHGTVGGVSPDNIPRAMENWIEWFNSMLAWCAKGGDLADKGVEIVIKEFLDIHPFSDGNGRTAWLLRVWLLNQWDDPQPLPNYYGEN